MNTHFEASKLQWFLNDIPIDLEVLVFFQIITLPIHLFCKKVCSSFSSSLHYINRGSNIVLLLRRRGCIQFGLSIMMSNPRQKVYPLPTPYCSDAGRCKTLGVPVVIGGDNLPTKVWIGLTNLPNIFFLGGGAVAPLAGPPQFRHHCTGLELITRFLVNATFGSGKKRVNQISC